MSASVNTTQERRLTLACVVDMEQNEGLPTRKKAYEEIMKAAKDYRILVQPIPFERLDYGESAVLDAMYSADVAIVDMSLSNQQITLSGHLGSRERFGMQGSFILYDSEMVHGLFKSNLGTDVMNSIGYALSEDGERCIVTDSWMSDSGTSLYLKLKQLLKDVQITSSTHAKEKFIDDLRKARETLSSAQLKQELDTLRHRFDADSLLISPGIVLNLLLSYRDIQGYSAMISLMEDIQSRRDQPSAQQCLQSDFMYYYAWALNRRNHAGDRAKALEVIESLCLSEPPYLHPDGICLCGRIYKDLFIQSNYSNREYIQKSIEWYRKGFTVKPNEYAGINLATLLVVSGEKVDHSTELQSLLIQLNHMIGKRGSLEQLTDYWTVATFFEMCVLARNFHKAWQAAECMYKLKPPLWHIQSTMGNIKLIDTSVKMNRSLSDGGDGDGNDSQAESMSMEDDEELYSFFLELFSDATAPKTDAIHFPVLILEDTSTRRRLVPHFVTVNADETSAGERSIKIWQTACVDGMDALFKPEHVKGAAPNKQDERCLFLYVAYNVSEGLQLYFSCGNQRDRFYQLCKEFLRSAEDFIDLDEEKSIEYDYEMDKNGQRVLLGSGTFGRVYAARDSNTQVKLAVKEIRVSNDDAVQPLHDEIKLHSKLNHKNIVQLHGSVYENGFFKIFMEQVPGGSLSDLLRGLWGPLKGNEITIAFYSRQILEGLKYLHDQKIVHRDIKGANVLVNTFSGVLKISDFGTCKRLSGLNSNASSFKGTFQYMAPEVIDAQSQRGYATPADIWSFGCTVVEMADGKPPFSEIASPMAAMFKVGKEKSHPLIPAELSELCRSFIELTFEVIPANRPTAADLLKHPFLTDTYKRKHRQSLSASLEGLLRSQSTPLDSDPFSTTEIHAKLRNVHSTNVVEGHNANVSTPSTTPAPGSPQPDSGDSTAGSHYWARKQDEAQLALLKVLSDENAALAVRMVEIFDNNNRDGQSLLGDAETDMLLKAIEQCVSRDETVGRTFAKILIEELKSGVEEADHTRLMKQLQLFLFLLKREVQDVLRKRSIKPHWMFAFDDMISRAVQTILQQMGGSFAGDDEDDTLALELDEPDRREYTSQTSTSVNSGSNAHHHQHHHLAAASVKLGKLQDTTAALMEQLIAAEVRYQELLRRTLNDKSATIRLLEAQLINNNAKDMPPNL
ncbi:Mitogen-activated protein kinase kinase kinase 15 [Hypsibius exemplaris]|uniref:Mitogen-activated protein kinase kinase kinase 15 n=1 Tax=Hypsibius exemplaris TaxID=2072580 RepID=A0A1W0XE33_HYPEX|nr:Mitogen-activated protein kinase kinase kinase 15 [Hypsibius exemplaris]